MPRAMLEKIIKKIIHPCALTSLLEYSVESIGVLKLTRFSVCEREEKEDTAQEEEVGENLDASHVTCALLFGPPGPGFPQQHPFLPSQGLIDLW